MRVFINRAGLMVAGILHSNKVRLKGKNHSNCGGEEISTGTLHGGEEISAGTLHGGEEISSGTLCANESIEGGALCASFSPGIYRTKDGTEYYKFGYVQVGDHFEINILEQPS